MIWDGCASIAQPPPPLASCSPVLPGERARNCSINCPQGISKLGVASVNVQTRSMRVRQAARQQTSDVLLNYAAEPMSAELSKPDIIDIDATHHADTQLCTAYVREIYEHLCNIENKHRIMVHYMSSQKDINATMRGILIDWLVEVAEEYRLVPETLYLAVNYIDRFLQCVPVNRGKLQLVGVTCMLIASYALRPPARAIALSAPRAISAAPALPR